MWEITRAQFIRRGIAAAGGLALLDPAAALARTAGSPTPIPGGFTSDFSATVPTGAAFHVLPPAVGLEMSTITNFKA
jgi:hypothetical protein